MADAPYGFVRGLSVIALCVLSFLVVSVQALDLSCIEVKKEYVKMGFPDDSQVPISPVSGAELQICPQGSTCCTTDMENKLKSLSTKEFDAVSNEAFKFMKTTFVSRTKKFDEFFTELLEKSQRELHDMFVRTYGLLYQQNAEVFTQLFTNLKSYYKGRNLNLVDILNDFFISLLKKLFELLHVQYTFDRDYLNCVSRHMDNLKPFGDVPLKLKTQVKRAFVAARTFVQGLAIGRDVILAMEKIKPTEACMRGMTRMMYCPYCRGLTRTKPCNNFCLNTMKGCLAHHSELNKAWNDYIEALQKLGVRLEGPFNIVTVMDPINVKLSEAIMNFQEESTVVSERIFKGCGTPSRKMTEGGRYKREEDAFKDTYTSFEEYDKDVAKKQSSIGSSLDRLVKDIKEKVQEARDFWVQLPYSICNGEIAAQPGEDEDCWNGQDRARYVHEVQKDGRDYQVNNPEVTVDVQEDNGIISLQIYNLKLITGKLVNAYNGFDVESHMTTFAVADGGSGDDLEKTSGTGCQESGCKISSYDDEDEYSTSTDDGSGPIVEDYPPMPTKRPGSTSKPWPPAHPDHNMPPYTVAPNGNNGGGNINNRPTGTDGKRGNAATAVHSGAIVMLMSVFWCVVWFL